MRQLPIRGAHSEAGLTLPDLFAHLMARLRIPEAYTSPSECIRAGHPLVSAPVQPHHFSHNIQRACGAFWAFWMGAHIGVASRPGRGQGHGLSKAAHCVQRDGLSSSREVVKSSIRHRTQRAVVEERMIGGSSTAVARLLVAFFWSQPCPWKDAHHAPWGPQPGLEEKLVVGQCKVGATTAIPSGWATHPDPCPEA